MAAKKYHSDNITFCCFHSRDPLLLPILEQEYVAPKVLNAILEEQVYWIINAVLEEQVYLIMPTLLHVVLLLKA